MVKNRLVVWEATEVCPCKCMHCDRHKIKKPKTGIPNLFNLKDAYILNITGGEPFMNPRLSRYINMLPSLKLVQISTTGYDPYNIALSVSQMRPKVSVSISIDGFEKTHDKIRGMKGLYRKAMLTYKLLKEQSNVRVSFQYTLSDKNIDEAEDFIKEFPNTAFVVPVIGEYYGNPKIKFPKEKVTNLLMKETKRRPLYSYYYNHVLTTINNRRKRQCLFRNGIASYMDVNDNMQRCHLGNDFDCNKCTQLCDSILHPFYNTREVALHYIKRWLQ